MTQHADREIARWTATSGHPQRSNMNHNLAFGGSPEFVIITKERKALFDYLKPVAIKFRCLAFILEDDPCRIQGQLHTTVYPAIVCTLVPCFPNPNARFNLPAQYSPWTTSTGLTLLTCVLPTHSLHNSLETCWLAACFKNVKRCRQQEWLEVFFLLVVLKFRTKPQYVPREVWLLVYNEYYLSVSHLFMFLSRYLALKEGLIFALSCHLR